MANFIVTFTNSKLENMRSNQVSRLNALKKQSQSVHYCEVISF